MSVRGAIRPRDQVGCLIDLFNALADERFYVNSGEEAAHGLLDLGERREGDDGRRGVFGDDEGRVHADRVEEVGGQVESGLADALVQGVLVHGQEVGGVFKK